MVIKHAYWIKQVKTGAIENFGVLVISSTFDKVMSIVFFRFVWFVKEEHYYICIKVYILFCQILCSL